MKFPTDAQAVERGPETDDEIVRRARLRTLAGQLHGLLSELGLL